MYTTIIKQYGATGRDLHIDSLLTNVSVAFQPQGLVAGEIAPIVGVTKQSNLYRIWNKADTLRIPDTQRAPAAISNKIESNVSSAAYFCKGYGLGAELPLEDISNSDNPMDDYRAATELVTNGLLMSWEARLATQLTIAANIGSSTTLSGVNQWTDIVNSDPVGDIYTAIDAVHATTGVIANRIAIGRPAFRALARHPQILELIFPHGSGGKFATAAQIAELFELEKIVVSRAVQNTAAEGLAGAYSSIFGGHCLVYYVPLIPALLTPSFMYSFRWKPSNFPAAFIVERTEKTGALTQKVVAIEVGYFQTEVIIAPELGYLIINASA